MTTTIATDLAATLGKIRRPAAFVASGTIELALPALDVDGVGRIALPLLEAQAAALAAAAERAPFGRGHETLVDTKVRRTWQLDPGKVRIEGAGWQRMLARIVERVAEGLGVTDPVTAEFYKLLLYGPGDFFVPHRDTEKSPGMFATLVLQLPSGSTGGDLVVGHKERVFQSDLKPKDPGEIGYAAFFADCLHEVLPVTAGHRLTLVYNLLRRGTGRPLKAPDFDRETSQLAELLRAWADAPAGEGRPEKLVYLLEHAYTAAEIGFGALKGADAGAANVLLKAAQAAHCDLHLAQLGIDESGWADVTDFGGRRRQSEPTFEVGGVDDRTATLSEWRRPDGSVLALAALPVEEDTEISPPEALSKLEPDDEEFSEATGNEGATFERSYRRAALVIWPTAHFMSILNQGGLDVTVPFLEDLVARFAAAADATRASLAAEIRQLAAHMFASWPVGFWGRGDGKQPSAGASVMTVLTRFGDGGLVEAFCDKALNGAVVPEADVPTLLAGLRLLSVSHASAILERLTASLLPAHIETACALLARAARDWPEVAQDAVKLLPGAMPGDSPDPRNKGRINKSLVRGMGFGFDLLSALVRLDEGRAAEAVATMLASPAVYGMDPILVPTAVRLKADPDLRQSPAVRRLCENCIAYLRAETARAPEAPADWARANTLGCQCASCLELAVFLADPLRKVWMLKASELARAHTESIVKQADVDLSCRLERSGRPYTLVCTKTDASFQRAAARHRRHLEQLAALEG